MFPPIRGRGCLAALLVASATAAGCSADEPPPPPPPHCGSNGAMAVAIGARANSAAINLPAELATRMTESARARYSISVVRIDGDPAVVFSESFRSPAGNGPALEADFTAYLGRLSAAFATHVKARAGEADPLVALTEAARSTGPGGTVVLIDSGLQTVSPLRFQDDGGNLVESQPEDTIAYLRDLTLLPDLRQRTVIFVGLGNTTPPQQKLNTRQRGKVTEIWKAIATASGASCVDVIDVPAAVPAVTGVPTVTVIPVPKDPPPPQSCGPTVLADNNGVGFLPDSDRFRDAAAARRTIGQLADLMKQGRQHADLVGTTANVGRYEGQQKLSEQRAGAVKRVLRDLGIADERITIHGVGSRWPGYVPDGGPEGPLLPGPAAANRKVIANLICDRAGAR
ncbi:MAG: OmpA family protein [Pseudonocardiaceae bacterium]